LATEKQLFMRRYWSGYVGDRKQQCTLLDADDVIPPPCTSSSSREFVDRVSLCETVMPCYGCWCSC